jgi:glycosyltransferase involved in cell wall biosynthesis
MERVFAELVRRLRRRYELVVLSIDLAPELEDDVEWHRVRAPARPAALRFAVFFVRAGMRLRRTRRDLVHTLGAIVPNRADVASVHFCHAGFVSAVGFAPSGAPLVRRLNTALTQAVCILAERWCYRPGRVRTLAAVSRGVGRELSRHYPGVPAVVTPNGVNGERFRPDASAREAMRESHGVASEDVVALFVGGDWDRKGLPVAIDAVARARARGASNLRIWVVGRGDEARARLSAGPEGGDAWLTFFGPRADTERFFQAADLFLFPTSYEAFPLVALEAVASGLPLVAPSVNGIEELIAAGAGLDVPRDPGRLADTLVQLARDAPLRARLSTSALERSSAYTWARTASSTAEAYAFAAAERGEGAG